ncbi:MAG: hypothetical protein IKQ49_08965 [Eubacterium sp.]|nr:hypothetical protein [Eubacterium sp.]
MTNKEIYKKTLVFSVKRLLFNTLCIVIVAVLATVGFVLLEKLSDKGLIGLGIGLVLGIIIVAVLAHFMAYTYQAGQIAMMTRAVTEGSLPDDVYGEGKRIVKEKFLTVAIYYAATRIIKRIFDEIGKLITGAGKAIGGDTGEGIAGAINIGIQVVIGFLSDCCLGWVFFRKDLSSGRATLEGAGIFFKHGKTLIRNLGRIFGMGIASLALIGGAFFGIFYLIFSSFPEMFRGLSNEIVQVVQKEGEQVSIWISDPGHLGIIIAGVLAFIIWLIIHGAFIRPFILVGVLRNYMEAGMAHIPTESELAEVAQKSRKFADLQKEVDKA